MELLQINTSVNRGSTGRIAEQIGNMAIREGFNSYIGYGRSNGSSSSQLVKIGNNMDWRFHALSSRLFDNHGFSSTWATKQFIKKIELIKPDIIHLHNIHGYYLNVEVLFNYLSTYNCPVVWTLHDCWPMTGHCAHFDFVQCKKWEIECNYCPNINGYPKSWYIDKSKRSYYKKRALFTSVKKMVFITPSKWLADIMKCSFFKTYPVQVVPNGVDVSIFNPKIASEIRSKYNLNKKKIILGVASTWNHRKGLDDFIQLNKLLSKGEQIVLVGINEKQKKQLPDDIIGISRTENVQELAALYAEADVFANPTWVDNFPTTNIEALACGTPVITYNTGGSPEAVSLETGKVVGKGDVNGLYQAIQTIFDQDKVRITQACRERAECFYNKEDRFADYIRLYKELLMQ